MATHSSVLAWRIPGMGEPGGLPSVGSHRVGHDWSDLAAAAVYLLTALTSAEGTWGDSWEHREATGEQVSAPVSPSFSLLSCRWWVSPSSQLSSFRVACREFSDFSGGTLSRVGSGNQRESKRFRLGSWTGSGVSLGPTGKPDRVPVHLKPDRVQLEASRELNFASRPSKQVNLIENNLEWQWLQRRTFHLDNLCVSQVPWRKRVWAKHSP